LASRAAAESLGERLEDTFLDLYDQEAPRVLAYLRASLGGAAEAEDLAADTFLRAWREWPRFRVTERPVHHWLLRIAHNLVIDRARRQGRRGVVPLADQGLAGTDVGEAVADRLQLLAAVGSLAPAEREVLALRAAGLPFAEVAVVVGKSEPAARMTWHRTARKLRDQLER
jgi:RNA polymerase sigma-70 factor (ECF subfamily)